MSRYLQLLCSTLLLVVLAACGHPTSDLPRPDPDPQTPAPVAAITASATEGIAPLEVHFDASSSTGVGLSYEWDFGDGGTASGVGPNHTFVDHGEFTVTLVITDERGEQDSDSIAIRTASHSAAWFRMNNDFGYVPYTAEFDASASLGSGLSYEWDFGDGSTGSGVTPSHEYTQIGSYTVTLTTTDALGNTATYSDQLQVAPMVAPAFTVSPAVGHSDAPFTFDASASEGSGLIYSWHFSDGTVTTGRTVEHVFLTPGNHTATLVISDSQGTSLTATQAIAAVEPANAEITASTLGATVGLLPIEFSATPGEGFSYSWQFGDGSSLVSGVSASHIYSATGEFEVTLTVVDLLGGIDSETLTVAIGQPLQQVTAGEFNVYLLDVDGALYAYGRGFYGAIGDGELMDRAVPVRVQFPAGVQIEQVAAGHAFALALDSTGQVWAWGEPFYNRLGLGSSTGYEVLPRPLTFVGLASTGRIVQISAGNAFGIALDDAGGVWGWGLNSDNQVNMSAGNPAVPVRITDPDIHPQFVQVDAGENHVLALTASGEVWGWGSNSDMQLTDTIAVGTNHPPTQIATGMQSVAAGDSFSIALNEFGEILHWGSPEYSAIDEPLPTLTTVGPGFAHIAIQSSNGLALRDDGTAFSWGRAGANGTGVYEALVQPSEVLVPEDILLQAIGSGDNLGVGIDQYGTVWRWGNGLLGLVEDAPLPLRDPYPAPPTP